MNAPYRDQSIKVPWQPAGHVLPPRRKRGSQIALTGEKALTAALVMLMLRDELRAGDCLKVRQNELANLLERGRG